MSIKIQDITCPSIPCDICAYPIQDGEVYFCLYHRPQDWNVHEKCAKPTSVMNGDLRDKLIREGHMESDTHDAVNHPDHYTAGGIECIDYLEAKGFGYHLGNAVKYISRAALKGNHEQDIKKAIWYLNRYLEKYINENTKQ